MTSYEFYNQKANNKNHRSCINNCNVWYGNQTTWQGLVGLLYPSDILYSMISLYWSTELNSDTSKFRYTWQVNLVLNIFADVIRRRQWHPTPILLP